MHMCIYVYITYRSVGTYVSAYVKYCCNKIKHVVSQQCDCYSNYDGVLPLSREIVRAEAAGRVLENSID